MFIKDLGLNGLEKTSTCMQLAKMSFISRLRVVEDVLVKVGNLIFPTDFYIIEINNEYVCTSRSILLGRPFLKTAKALINIDKGLLNVEFDCDIVSFNVFYDVNWSSNDHVSLCALNTLEPLELLETLQEHEQFNKLTDQATLKYVDNVFAKNEPSDDDLSIFLNFVGCVNEDHALVNEFASNGQHLSNNDFAYTNELDLGKNLDKDDEYILEFNDIDDRQDIDIHIKVCEKEHDLNIH
ncbi:hypothetical protein IC575_008590 [Cucumis melo]